MREPRRIPYHDPGYLTPRDSPLPRYLTSPGDAISQRRRWETRMTEEMRWVLLHHEGTWASKVEAMVNDIEGMPDWMHALLLRAEHDDPEQVVETLGRTVATATYNASALATLSQAGVRRKRWITRRDNRVRPSHHEVDGTVQPLARPFSVGGYPQQFPGDHRTAPIEEWIGCRCVLVAV